MADEFDVLQERLTTAPPVSQTPKPSSEEVAQADGSKVLASMTKCQWACLPNDSFTAIGQTRSHLPAGVYTLTADSAGTVYFTMTKIVTDSLIELDDSASLRVISGIDKFWQAKPLFERFGILFKRGVLLWGPAGSGKTATVNLLTNDLVKRGGMVVIIQAPNLAVKGLQELRRIEPERPIIIILEDIEEIISAYGEHTLLSLLDGEHQVNNVVVIGTTNYPEKLGDRIINRPSRFDEVILVDMPSAKARYLYLKHVLKDTVGDSEITAWVEATDKLSIAHLRELIVATQCLGRPYQEVVARLRKMRIRPASNKRGQDDLGFTMAEATAVVIGGFHGTSIGGI